MSLETACSLLTGIYDHCEKISTNRDAIQRLQRVVGVFRPLLNAYRRELGHRAAPAWVPALEDALREALKALRSCADNPVKTKLFPSSYTGKLEKARTEIRDAMEGIALSNAAVSVQARDTVTDLAQDFKDLETHLHLAREENEALVAQMMEAMRGGFDDVLSAIAHDNELGDADELRRQLVDSEAHHQEQLKHVKDSAAQQELQAAIALSRMAAATMSTCPDDFRCAITLELMENPYILTQSGHTYEKKAIQHALVERPDTAPYTNKRFEGEANLVPNHQLRGAIQQGKQQQAQQAQQAQQKDDEVQHLKQAQA